MAGGCSLRLGPPPDHRELESHLRLKLDLNALNSVIKFRNPLFLFSYWFLISKSLKDKMFITIFLQSHQPALTFSTKSHLKNASLLAGFSFLF